MYMYVQSTNTNEAKLWEECAIQNYSYFVHRQTHECTDRYMARQANLFSKSFLYVTCHDQSHNMNTACWCLSAADFFFNHFSNKPCFFHVCRTTNHFWGRRSDGQLVATINKQKQKNSQELVQV